MVSIIRLYRCIERYEMKVQIVFVSIFESHRIPVNVLQFQPFNYPTTLSKLEQLIVVLTPQPFSFIIIHIS